MVQELARIDHENVIERRRSIEVICDYFEAIGNQKVIVSLFGESGVGKSYVCRTIFTSNIIVPSDCKVLVDLNRIVNNNVPGIIQSVMSTFGFGFFVKTQFQLDKYFKSIDASKEDYLTTCVNTFIDELNKYARERGGVLLIFDTFEAISATAEKTGFNEIIKKTNEYVSFLISGTEKVNLRDSAAHHLKGFEENEIIEFLVSRNSRIRNVFKKHGTLLAAQIRRFTDEGNPILCGLISDWLSHCRDLNSQVQYLLQTETGSRKHLVSWISNLDEDLCVALRLTSFFNDRMTVDLLSELSGMDVTTAENCLYKMEEFTFVKPLSEELDSNPQVVLHDVVAELIRDNFAFSADELHVFTEKAIAVYDKMILEDRNNADAFKIEQSLRVEKVMCVVRNGIINKALSLFDNEILDGVDVFDYSFIDQLINEVEGYFEDLSQKPAKGNNDTQEQWKYVLQIARAEEELSRYNAKNVIGIYQNLEHNPLYSRPEFEALADDVFARALINPCTVEYDDAVTEAIKRLKRSIKKIEEKDFNRRLVKSFYWLGNAYVRSGQNDKAQTAYERALALSQTDIQKVTLLLDMSKMLRLQQDAQKAFIPLQKCDVIMESSTKNKGKYHYYKGNAYRDIDDIKTAIVYYNKAFEELAGGDDNFSLCELNMDYAWLQYIRDDIQEIDIKEVRKYLEAGWSYAERYQFGTEYSEYHHILYEILNYLGQYDEAYDHLNQAIRLAYKYSNIYMMLDCLNHKAQQYYREKKYEKVPEIIEEMQRIEKTGCKIRVFRGRAKLIQADIYFLQRNYMRALQEYFEGFVIVALYGNSRTNVELFDDLYNKKEEAMQSRKEKMLECLSRVENPDRYRKKFRRVWNDKKISHDYKYFLDGLQKTT